MQFNVQKEIRISRHHFKLLTPLYSSIHFPFLLVRAFVMQFAVMLEYKVCYLFFFVLHAEESAIQQYFFLKNFGAPT